MMTKCMKYFSSHANGTQIARRISVPPMQNTWADQSSSPLNQRAKARTNFGPPHDVPRRTYVAVCERWGFPDDGQAVVTRKALTREAQAHRTVLTLNCSKKLDFDALSFARCSSL